MNLEPTKPAQPCVTVRLKAFDDFDDSCRNLGKALKAAPFIDAINRAQAQFLAWVRSRSNQSTQK